MKTRLAKLAATISIATLAACGGGGGGDDSKNLFSMWTSVETGGPLDLTGAKFGPDNNINFYSQDGTRCICDLAIIGAQESGTLAVTGCVSVPFNASVDAQCVALQGSGTYTKTSDVLTINRNGGTGNFR